MGLVAPAGSRTNQRPFDHESNAQPLHHQPRQPTICAMVWLQFCMYKTHMAYSENNACASCAALWCHIATLLLVFINFSWRHLVRCCCPTMSSAISELNWVDHEQRCCLRTLSTGNTGLLQAFPDSLIQYSIGCITIHTFVQCLSVDSHWWHTAWL